VLAYVGRIHNLKDLKGLGLVRTTCGPAMVASTPLGLSFSISISSPEAAKRLSKVNSRFQKVITQGRFQRKFLEGNYTETSVSKTVHHFLFSGEKAKRGPHPLRSRVEGFGIGGCGLGVKLLGVECMAWGLEFWVWCAWVEGLWLRVEGLHNE